MHYHHFEVLARERQQELRGLAHGQSRRNQFKRARAARAPQARAVTPWLWLLRRARPTLQRA
jgi:hypothetical protein